MKKLLILLLGITFSCAEPPIAFSEEALNENILDMSGTTASLEDVLKTFEGKTVLIDVWASWCGDCIQGMPVVKLLQQEFPQVEFVFLSVDRSEEAWKRGVGKYNVKGHNYFIPEGQHGAFGDFLNSNWIPRYLVIDKQGKIKLFKAKKATDVRIKEALQ